MLRHTEIFELLVGLIIIIICVCDVLLALLVLDQAWGVTALRVICTGLS